MQNGLEKRIKASKGEIPFDVLFINANIINTYTHRVLINGSVGVVDGIIATVCPSFEVQAKEVIDCKGMYLSPSFIDTHMHIESSRLNPKAYAQAAVPHGSGCIMTDPMQLVNATGDDGIFCFLDMLKSIPMRCFLQFPSRVPVAKGKEHSGASFSPKETMDRLNNSRALTLGEVNAYDLLEPDTFEKIFMANEKNILINGHCPGFNSDELMSAAAAHIRDDHESENFIEALDRLNAGISVMVREGTIEPNCREIIRGVVKEGIPCENLMFCTDDKSPEDIVQNGCIDNCVRIAISEGLDPIEAICIATINAAKHFHLEDKMGVIAPGRYADFVLFDSLEKIEIKQVFFGGVRVANHGKALIDFSLKEYEQLRNTINLPVGMNSCDLSPKWADNQVVISMLPNSLMTKKDYYKAEYDELGRVIPDIIGDILPIAVIDRYTGLKHVGNALICGLGIKKGAIASSCAQEGNNVVVSGCNYDDMLLAVNEVERIGGGNVIVIDGKIAGVRRLPLGGIVSDEKLDDALESSKKYKEALHKTGSINPMLMAMLTVSLCPSIPEIGLTDLGIIEYEK